MASEIESKEKSESPLTEMDAMIAALNGPQCVSINDDWSLIVGAYKNALISLISARTSQMKVVSRYPGRIVPIAHELVSLASSVTTHEYLSFDENHFLRVCFSFTEKSGPPHVQTRFYPIGSQWNSFGRGSRAISVSRDTVLVSGGVKAGHDRSLSILDLKNDRQDYRVFTFPESVAPFSDHGMVALPSDSPHQSSVPSCVRFCLFFHNNFYVIEFDGQSNKFNWLTDKQFSAIGMPFEQSFHYRSFRAFHARKWRTLIVVGGWWQGDARDGRPMEVQSISYLNLDSLEWLDPSADLAWKGDEIELPSPLQHVGGFFSDGESALHLIGGSGIVSGIHQSMKMHLKIDLVKLFGKPTKKMALSVPLKKVKSEETPKMNVDRVSNPPSVRMPARDIRLDEKFESMQLNPSSEQANDHEKWFEKQFREWLVNETGLEMYLDNFKRAQLNDIRMLKGFNDVLLRKLAKIDIPAHRGYIISEAKKYLQSH